MPAQSAVISRRDLTTGLLGTGIALAVAPLPAGATGVVRLDPASKIQDRQILALSQSALKVKLIGSGSLNAVAQTGLMTIGARRSANLDALGEPDTATFWAQFFRSAQFILGHAEGSAPVIGFYNPILDYWWLTQWAPMHGTFAIVDTRFIPNERLRATPVAADIAELPPWMTSLGERSLIESLRATCRSASANFQRIFPLEGSSGAKVFASVAEPTGARTAMLARMLIVAGEISHFFHDDAVAPLSRRLCAAMAQPQPVAAGLALSREAQETFGIIARTPAIVRQNLGVVAALPIQGHWLVVHASAQSGQNVLVAVINGQSTPPTIERLGMVNVMAGS